MARLKTVHNSSYKAQTKKSIVNTEKQESSEENGQVESTSTTRQETLRFGKMDSRRGQTVEKWHEMA